MPDSRPARGGKPAKRGLRTPSGRLSRARACKPAQDPRQVALGHRLRIGADGSKADDPRWVTPWGSLLLRDMLDAAQHDTADRYADLLVEVRRIQGLGRPWPSGALAERGRLAKRRAEAGESERELSRLVLAEEAATRLRRLGRQTKRAL